MTKMSKKSFKSSFTAPVKSGKQDRLFSSPLYAVQRSTSPNNVSAQYKYRPEKNENAKKLPAISLTDAEYEEIFNSAIKSVMSMAGSQRSSQSCSNIDSASLEDQVIVPEPEEAQRPRHVAARTIPRTHKANISIVDHHGREKESVDQASNHPTEKNKGSGKIKAYSSKRTPVNYGIKPKKLFKEVSKKQKASEMNETSNHALMHIPQSFSKQKGKATNISSKHIIPYVGSSNEDIPFLNQGMQHCRLHSGERNNSFSRANTPTHQHTPCRAHFHSQHCKENHDSNYSINHTPCRSHVAARTYNTPLRCNAQCHSHSSGSYIDEKSDSIPAFHHKSLCPQNSNVHSIESRKFSQNSHAQHTTNSQSQPILSQPPPEFSLKERLLWLQQRRDVGLWVQCSYSHCSKWRYLYDIHDPVEIPEKWYCHMNQDKHFNSCSIPEKGPTAVEEEDLIHNVYTAGSIVWARLDGYPWWPAMVDDDPDTEQYYWLNGFSDIPTHYNVTFFDDKEITRAWLTPTALKPFTGRETAKLFKKTRIHGIDYSKRIEIARSKASEAVQLSVGERLRKCSFLSQFKGPFGKLKNKSKGKGYDDSGNFSSDDNHTPRKKKSKAMKRKQNSFTIDSSTKPLNKRIGVKQFVKEKVSEKRCSNKFKYMHQSMSEKENEIPIKTQEGSMTQSNIIHNDEKDDDYEVNSSQDLFLSQEKKSPKKNGKEETNSTKVTPADNSSARNNTSQSQKSPETSQNVKTAESKPSSSSNNSKKEKLLNSPVMKQTAINTETMVTTSHTDRINIPEASDAIVPCSQSNTSHLEDAVVPNIEESYVHNRDDNDNECNNSDNSADFEVEE